MNSLERRVDALEQAHGKGGKPMLWVDHASDGGLVYGGKVYADTSALLSALGLEEGAAFVIGWEPGRQTAAELLEAAQQPRPEASVEELLECGHQLAAQGARVSPAVEKNLGRVIDAMTPEERLAEAKRIFGVLTQPTA